MKRHLALLTAALMLALALPFGALASGAADTARALGYKGSGTEADPYSIASGEELFALSRAVNSGLDTNGLFIALENDIDLSGTEWEPIGRDAEHPFSGSFDGRGFTVSRMRITSGKELSALFGYSVGAIKGIVLKDSSVQGGSRSAGIVGFGAAEECISFARVTGADKVGGVVGEGAAYDCISYGAVTGVSMVGGVIGEGDAYRSEGYGSVTAQRLAGGVAGLGPEFECRSEAAVSCASESAPKGTHSVAKFIRWALKRVDPASIPTNANLYLAAESCGTSPWEYIYGTVRVPTNQSTINSFYNNYYTKYMLRGQFDDNTADWSRSTYATDCQGLMDAFMTYEEGVTTDINAMMNYTNWCTSKGEIEDIDRPWVVGEAVFTWSRRLNKIGHVGWICGFDEDGEPLAVEARGLAFGVVVTRLSDRAWTHRGLMTAQFNYDAYMDAAPAPDGIPCGEETEEAFVDRRAVPAPGEVWNGSAALSYGGGSGTEEDPFLINDASQLALLSAAVANGNSYNGMYFALTNDIWVNDTEGWEDWDMFNAPANVWTPIGFYTNNSTYSAFRGSFDGRGHTVYGLYYSDNKKSCMGLFGIVGPNPTGCIKNVTVSRSFQEAVNDVGGIVGYLKDYGRIDNCHHTSKVHGDQWTGGIVGYVTNTQGTTVVYNCTNTGNVRCSCDTGGIVGFAHENCIISQCSNRGSQVKGYMHIGGIVGTAWASTVKKCRNDNAVKGTDLIGGVVGDAANTAVFECYNGRDLTTRYRTGGIAGRMAGGSLTDSFNTGDVTALEDGGGLVGCLEGASADRCYNVGTITVRRVSGGAAGLIGGGTVGGYVYIADGCCLNGNSLGTSLPLAAFTLQSSYQGFDFQSVWIIDAETDYPFAELKNARYTAEKLFDVDPVDPPVDPPEPSDPPEPPESLPGDADGNGEVNAEDALLTLRLAMGMIDSVPRPDNADVNSDGNVDGADALVILRMAMGMETEL